MILTEPLARAAAQDAGNRSMRTAGRKTWSAEDWNAAQLAYDEFWPIPEEESIQTWA